MSVQAAVAFLNGNASNPPSKPWTSHSTTANARQEPDRIRKRTNKPITSIDVLIQELTAMYEEALDKYQQAQDRIKQLEADVELYASDATKVRDYEIRVEYLAQKLEQVSEERDNLEQELRMQRQGQGRLDTPVSPIFQHRLSDLFDKKSINEEGSYEQSENGEFLHGILGDYVESDDQEEEDEQQQDQPQPQHEQDTESAELKDPQQQIEFLTEQLRAYDKFTKDAVQDYLSQLEKQRLHNKALHQVLRKQDELISTLESKLNSNNNNVSSVSPVSASKRTASRPPRGASLAISTAVGQARTMASPSSASPQQQRLLREHEQLTQQLLNEQAREQTTSIDFLAELARPAVDGKSTPPPPTAPPREPLPPLPSAASTTSPVSLASGGSSPVTSWSSGENGYKNQIPSQVDSFYASYLKSEFDDNDDTSLDHHMEALRRLEGPGNKTSGQKAFWKGVKQKLTSPR